MKNAALIVLVAAALAGCASKETQTEPQVTDRSVGQPQANAGQSSTTRPNQPTTSQQGNPLAQGQLAQRSVYFDYDSNAVKDEYRGLVQAHSRYLTGDKRDARIRIEGNCDERGSREYNLALGQRRAESVRSALKLLGVQDSQVEAVSFGKEKPVDPASTEEAWAKNRRAEIVYR
jgi:peptidoglycan-associated lipoprotein